LIEQFAATIVVFAPAYIAGNPSQFLIRLTAVDIHLCAVD